MILNEYVTLLSSYVIANLISIYIVFKLKQQQIIRDLLYGNQKKSAEEIK